MSLQCLYVTKKAYFRPKLAIFWAKILIFWRGSKSFGTHISENQLGTSFPLFFCAGIATKWTRKASIWLKMTKSAFFSAKNPNFKGGSKTFGILILGDLLDTCFVVCVKNSDRRDSNGPLRTKKCNFYAKNLIFGTKSQFFVLESQFFVKRAYHQYTRGYPGKISNPKKIPFPR